MYIVTWDTEGQYSDGIDCEMCSTLHKAFDFATCMAATGVYAYVLQIVGNRIIRVL